MEDGVVIERDLLVWWYRLTYLSQMIHGSRRWDDRDICDEHIARCIDTQTYSYSQDRFIRKVYTFPRLLTLTMEAVK